MLIDAPVDEFVFAVCISLWLWFILFSNINELSIHMMRSLWVQW